jgi:DNA-binding NarL/FixJ family response regulator
VKLILIADDHPSVRACLRRLLNRQLPDCQISEADNGREAILRAEEFRPDLVVLDMSMPIMNGLDAARELKRKTPLILLVLWTTFADPVVERVASTAGFDAVAPKADGGVVLIQIIQQLLRSGLAA